MERITRRAQPAASGRPTRRHAVVLVVAATVALALGLRADGAVSGLSADCSTNAVECENQLPGAPQSEWDIVGSGDPSIQGFASPFSIDSGSQVDFRVLTDAADYRIDVYRLGWYGGLGARKITTLLPQGPLPQSQPDCIRDEATGLVDCGNWAVSASWDVPADAVSGVYVAKLVRTDTGGESHMHFVVRDDDGGSQLLVQTSDTTWQAYNRYGGNSLYFGSPAGRAYKVSYNRPFTTRGHTKPSFFFSGEYPMIRWLERNGYDVSYSSGRDTASRGAELLEHKAFLSVGHDEYWSADQRANVEAARDAGVSLAFFSGNEVFWKTRWESSIDGRSTPYTTLVSYKETAAHAKIDPDPAWTGTWRDARFSPPADGGRPENALTGTLFTVNSYREDALRVPAEFAPMRFWRNTSVALLTSGQTAIFPAGILGHEWDEDVDNGFRPAGLFNLSATTVTVDKRLVDQGTTYTTGTARHALTLYRAPSGALVFGAGTVQWSWGLDDVHDVINGPPLAPDVRMQQATVNLLGDMGAYPASLQSGLVAATPSTDVQRPASTITTPSSGTVVRSGTVVSIAGTATESGGGKVAAVEVTTDGGATWHRATGRAAWSYQWTAGGDSAAIVQTRAVDDSGNIETPKPGIVIEVACPCFLWPSAVSPGTKAAPDTQSVELGVKVRADVDGWMTGLRFYKGTGNAGPHFGSLWSADGTLLSRALFTGETTTGWQEVQLDAPVPVTAGTTYVASYHAPVGRYSLDRFYFQSSSYTNVPLRAPATGAVSGGNGVFAYGTDLTFPTQTYSASNYWVDVVFYDREVTDTRRPRVVAMAPAANAVDADARGSVEATFSEAVDPATVSSSSFELRTAAGALVPATVSYDPALRRAILTPTGGLAYQATYTATLKTGTAGVKDPTGNTLDKTTTWSFQTEALRPCPCTLWSASDVPSIAASADTGAVEVGVKFTADLAGWISGVRFYKGSGNGGTHVGSLWTAGGALLARATFTGESSSGWQQVLFDGPVQVSANTTYIASYHAPNGRYSLTPSAFSASGFVNPPLRTLRSEAGSGNGVYRYGSAPTFPDNTYGASNYWVDVVFSTAPPPDAQPPRVTSYAPAAGTTVGVEQELQASFSEPLNPATVTSQTFVLTRSDGAAVPATVTYDSSGTAHLRPVADLELGRTYVATLRGGPTGLADAAGNTLAADVTWSFSTVNCPCTIWAASAQPAQASAADTSPVEVGLKFRSDRAGWITAVRFYKGGANSGTHIGSLWTADGTLLARATFQNETPTGWQEVAFGAPVEIAAGVTYVVSYFAPSGGYARTGDAFAAAGASGTHLSALRNGEQGGNGVYRYSSSPVFPTSSWEATNYWVDAVFTPTRPPDSNAPEISYFSPATGEQGVPVTQQVVVGFGESMDPASITASTITLEDATGHDVAATVTYDTASRRATLTPQASLEYGSEYTVRVRGGAQGAKDVSDNALAADVTSSFTTKACPCGLWTDAAAPAIASALDPAAVELGVRFQADLAGTVRGIRFYKGAGNDGTHVGSLWRTDGTLLARATFIAESATGWQQALFAQPVAIEAGTDYIASYHAPQGRYAVTPSYFGGATHVSAPLRAPAGSNGVYTYSAEATFPTQSWQSSNYWVDVLFDPAG